MRKTAITIYLFLQSITPIAYAIELSEISFKDTTSDWIEITLNDTSDIPDTAVLVRGDSTITQLEPSEIANKKFILIHFKSESENFQNDGEILHIFTTKSGLTGTTEQLTLETISGEIIDAVCWKNSSPPDSEIKDQEELGHWGTNCQNSEEIDKNHSIAKINNQWQILPHPTPGQKNELKNRPPTAKIEIQAGELQKEIPFSLNLDGSNSSDPDNDDLTYLWSYPNNTIIEKKNPSSYRFEKAGTYNITLTVTDTLGASNKTSITITALPKSSSNKTSNKQANGDLSSSITITEIFPNPSGKDSGKEWIELYNNSNTNVNLNNWKLNNKTINSLIIKANSFAIYNTPLKNSENNIKLIDFNETLIDQIDYDNSKEGKSFTKVMIKDNQSQKISWQWSSPSKNTKNPIYEVLKGKVTTPPTISEDFYFEIKDTTGKNRKIIFPLEDFKFDFLSTLLQKDTELSLLIYKSSQQLILKDYYIKKSPPSQKQDQQNTKILWPYYLAPVLIASTLGLLFTTKPK